MKILDRYLLSQFIIVLFGAVLLILGLYIITIYIDNLKYFSSRNVPFSLILNYIAFIIPEIAMQVLPVAALFSTSYLFGNLNSTNEIIAIYNGIIGFTRLITPLLIAGIFFTIFSIFFFEYVSADYSSRAFEIRNQIKQLAGKDINYMYVYSKFFLKGKNNTIYYLEHFDSMNGIMISPVLFKFDSKGNLEFELSARNGVYNKKEKVWNFSNALIIRSDDKGKYIREQIPLYTMNLYESPKSFMKTPKTILQMRYNDALNFIDAQKRLGGNYKKYEVEFHWRFAVPFSVVIVILIGSLAGIYLRKAVFVLSFFLSLVLSFGYYGLLAFGVAFGKSGRIDPIAAAWLGNVVYLLAGFITLRIKR